MIKSTYEYTKSFCKAVEQTSGALITDKKEWKKQANLRVALIMEELCELMTGLGADQRKVDQLWSFYKENIDVDDGYKNGVYTEIEIADALADLDVVVNNAGVFFDMPMDKLALEVYTSNMSKLCETEEEAQESVEAYLAKGLPAAMRQNSEGKWIIYNSETGKVMKGINFKVPDIGNVLEG